MLQGNELIDSQISVAFGEDSGPVTLCTSVLDERDSEDFGEAVGRQYWYELFLDDLPIWGLVGPPQDATGLASATPQVYTHRTFDVAYNGDRVIHVNLTSERPEPATKGAALAFSASIRWHPVDVPFERRFERYLDASFFEHQIHWFSVFNAFMMVLFLAGLVAMILARTLRRDYARYSREGPDDLEALERDLAEESGWKLVHGDVFRSPKRLGLLSAAIGTGTQLASLVLATLAASAAGELFAERGAIVTAFIVLYAFTSFVGGYASGGFYSRHGGRRWIGAWLLTAHAFPAACLGIALALDLVATAYGSLAAVPVSHMLIVLLIWVFLSSPLCLLGTVVGRHWGASSAASEAPCRVKRIPSPIPHRPWYLRPWSLAAAGGLLPFGSIFIEMYFVFTSLWNYKVYYVYGFFLLVFGILLLVSALASAVATYFLLNAEDHRWHWTAFGAGASTGLYVFFYAIHYFFAKTRMTGLFQTAFYFGYTLMFCLGLALVCGSAGHAGANAFVRRIYRNVKCD